MGNVFFAYRQLSSLTKNMFRDFLGELGLFFAGFCVGMKKLVAFTSLVPGCKNIRGQKSSPYTESSSQNQGLAAGKRQSQEDLVVMVLF